jgi:putative tryptophan/tyrosine transport system substrate-binding protein
LGGKWLALLNEIAPSVARVALLFNPVTDPYAGAYLPTLEPPALSHGMGLSNMTVQSADEMDRAIGAFAGESNRGLLVLPDNFLFLHRDRIVASRPRFVSGPRSRAIPTKCCAIGSASIWIGR